MKKQNVLVILIVVLSVLLFLTVGAIVYLVYKGNATFVVTQVTSSLSSSKETLNYNYVNLADYKDKVKIQDYQEYSLYYTNLAKPTGKEETLNPSSNLDLLLQNGNSEKAILLTDLNADAFDNVTTDFEKAALATRIDQLSDNGKYITLDLQSIGTVEDSSVVLYSLETGKYIVDINYYARTFPNNGSNPAYIIFGDYVISQTLYENAPWDTGVESGIPLKLIMTNLISKTSQNLVIPDHYTDIVIKSISSGGILSYDLQKALNSDDYKNKFTTETKTLDLNTFLNK